jgi:hypothetical protein
LLPALGLLCSVGLAALPKEVETGSLGGWRAAWLGALLVAAAVTVGGQRDPFFSWSPERVGAETYPSNPFSEVVEIARYVREHSSPGERIAVLGSEPQIYFYADRRAAARYVYVYALMEAHEFALTLQKQVIGEIEASRPSWVVVVRTRNSWLLHSESNRLILNWMAGYLASNYTVEGLVEMGADGPSTFQWGPDVRTASPKSEHFLLVCRRKR